MLKTQIIFAIIMITSITIIEDDLKYALLLKKVIDSNSELACIEIYNNLKSSLSGLAQKVPDVVLLDIQLPDGLGSDYVEILKKICPSTHFIMCTSFENDEYIFDSLKSGASGYILKSDTPAQIVNAIIDVTKGGAPMSLAIAKKVVSHFNTKLNILEELTAKENELLGLLAKGLLYKEVAIKMNVTMDTVKKHASNIYKKLQVNNKTEAINMFNIKN